MKYDYRVLEYRGEFYPQVKSKNIFLKIFGWFYFKAEYSNTVKRCYSNLTAAKHFLEITELRANSKTLIHKYP